MKKWFSLILAFVLVLSLSACNIKPIIGEIEELLTSDRENHSGNLQQEQNNGTKKNTGNFPAKDIDAEFTIVIDGTDSWTPFEGIGGITFTNEKTDVVSISDDGKTVTFTGLAVGETTIIASDGKHTASALVKVVKRSEEVSYYLTYKDPISHYSYEIDGGPENDGSKVTFDGETHWEYYYQDGYLIGNWNTLAGAYSFTENGEQIAGIDYDDDDAREGRKSYFWPCSDFAEIITGRPLDYLYANAPERLPDQLDVSEYYAGSEQICGVDCNIFRLDTVMYGYEMLYWVDPETGWTLQYARQDQSTDEIEIWWTVTSFQIGEVDE